MLDRIQTYISNSKDYLKQFISRSQAASTASICSISFTSNQVYLVLGEEFNNQLTVRSSESHSYASNAELLEVLKNFVKENNIQNAATCLILQPEDYQLLVTDTLPVAANEFQAAIRWKIKDLLRYPMQDVVIDSFNLPKMKNNVNKIMVAAAQESKLKTWCDLITQAELNLTVIEIPDLAIRNIITLFKQESAAFIHIQENSIQLLIIYEQKIYVSRFLKFSLGTTEETAMAGIDRLALDLQRSFDYYQSLWENPMPTKLLYSSVDILSSQSIDYLSQKIRIPVEKINLNEVIKYDNAITSETEAKFLACIGGLYFIRRAYPQEINLYHFLPQARSEGLNQKTALASYGAFILFLLFFYLFSFWHKHRLENEIYQLAQSMEKNKQELAILSQQYPHSNSIDLKKRIDELQKTYEQKTQVVELLSPNANFSAYLNGLAATIVPGIWLSEITFSRDEKNIILKGYALEPSLLEKFYNNLAGSSVFAKLNFSVSEVRQTGYPANFYITGIRK